jgi:hypothetical protein
MEIFDRDKDGYMIVLPGTWIGGDITYEHPEPRVWVAKETDGNLTYTGTGDGPQTALLALILDRLGYRVDGEIVWKDES